MRWEQMFITAMLGFMVFFNVLIFSFLVVEVEIPTATSVLASFGSSCGLAASVVLLAVVELPRGPLRDLALLTLLTSVLLLSSTLVKSLFF